MRHPGDPETLLRLLRETAPIADEKRGCHRPRLPRLGRNDAFLDRTARPRNRQIGREPSCRLFQLPAAEQEAAAADPVKERSTVGVVAAGDDGSADRHESGAQRHARAERRQPVTLGERQTDLLGHRRGLEGAGGEPVEHDPWPELNAALVAHHAA